MKIEKLVKHWEYLVSTNYGTTRGFVRYALGQVEYLVGRVEEFSRINPRATRRLVFVCLGNINRSAFAAAVAQSLSANTVSIGLSTTTGARCCNPALKVAKLFNISLDTHAATDISDYEYCDGDMLCAMEIRHARHLVRRGVPQQSVCLLGNWARPHRIHLHDPATLSEQYFVTCFGIIHTSIVNLVNELRLAKSPCVAEQTYHSGTQSFGEIVAT